MIGRVLVIFVALLIPVSSFSQIIPITEHTNEHKNWEAGTRVGIGWAYEDNAHLYNTVVAFSLDYRIAPKWYLQFIPAYSWLWKWNEHYLTLPIHIRKIIDRRLSIFAGSALTYDVGYFKDLGISAGAYFHLDERSAIVLSAFTFTLYDYHIDYLYVPISLSFHYTF